MDERLRREWAANEAQSFGRGGISCVSRATGLSRNTIRRGIKEAALRQTKAKPAPDTRVRRPGGGRKPLSASDPGLWKALDALLEPKSLGDPRVPLRWTCKSTTQLADELTRQSHPISPWTVGNLLKAAGYSLQGSRKAKQTGGSHPDRNAQFEFIDAMVRRFQQCDLPVIWVNTKKQEFLGKFTNAGRKNSPKGVPDEVRVHDFMDEEPGNAIPGGDYDLNEPTEWANVSIDHDTARFAVQAILRWWHTVGGRRYPRAGELLLLVGGGGNRRRLWKLALPHMSTRLKMIIHVSHFPPGTSKWNRLEHRLCCHIAQSWHHGRPHIVHEVIINSIAPVTPHASANIPVEVERGPDPLRIGAAKDQCPSLPPKPGAMRGTWNYVIDWQ
jgi:hypothetical protein